MKINVDNRRTFGFNSLEKTHWNFGSGTGRSQLQRVPENMRHADFFDLYARAIINNYYASFKELNKMKESSPEIFVKLTFRSF